jgi:succinate-semialdehyde dehydrogenase/glutarate-semialdehyde dehydrogenase
MKSLNPATEEFIAEYPEHTTEQIEKKILDAQKAFESWRKLPMPERARLMKSLATTLFQEKGGLARLMTLEVGKPITAGESEVEKCAACCEYFAENAGRFLAARAIASDAEESFVRFDPLGVILAIMPWNFPFWQVFRFAAPSLMAGNVGLLKHAPNVPGCSLAIERLFAEAGFPSGVFSALLVSDNARAQKLVEHPVVRAVTLTGSERAGAAVASSAGKFLKKSVMELGGSDPFIVLGDADIEAAAAAAASSRCINSGQSCIAAKRFIVAEKIADAFEGAMIAAMQKMKIGDPMLRETEIGPLAREDLLVALHEQVIRSARQGAVVRMGGRRMPRRGFFYEPTVLTGVSPGMAVFEEETFGPVAAIVRAKDAEDAVNLANQSKYGLGASIWTKDKNLARELARQIEAGCVFINGVVKSDPRSPFGGIKNSGWGRELSEFGILEFVNVKTVWMQ